MGEGLSSPRKQRGAKSEHTGLVWGMARRLWARIKDRNNSPTKRMSMSYMDLTMEPSPVFLRESYWAKVKQSSMFNWAKDNSGSRGWMCSRHWNLSWCFWLTMLRMDIPGNRGPEEVGKEQEVRENTGMEPDTR